MRRPERPSGGLPLEGTRVAVVNWRDRDNQLAGGAERYAWEFARGLHEAGARVEFVTSRDAGQAGRSTVDGIDVVRRGGAWTYFPWAAWHLLRNRRRLTAVIDASTGVPTFAPLFVKRRTPVVLVMHHVHLDQFGTHFPPLLAWVGRTVEGRLMPLVYRHRRTIAVSESTREEMYSRLRWRGRIDLMFNGSDQPVDPGRPAEKQARRLVVLGRLVVHKQVPMVLRAVASLSRELPDLTVDVVGRGPEQQSVERLVRSLGLVDRVKVRGFVDEETKGDILRRAGLHVCASDAEGWGQVVIETAAYGVPTVARRVPGLRDSIVDGETGWLVPADGGRDAIVDGLASTIRKAVADLEDPLRSAEISAACRTRAAQFSWAAMRAESAALVAREIGTTSPEEDA